MYKKKGDRKDYSKEGRGQKMMSFRLDLDLIMWLNQFQNKGRKINELIRRARNADRAFWEDDDVNPDENNVEENLT